MSHEMTNPVCPPKMLLKKIYFIKPLGQGEEKKLCGSNNFGMLSFKQGFGLIATY